jgi:hypothetical protein
VHNYFDFTPSWGRLPGWRRETTLRGASEARQAPIEHAQKTCTAGQPQPRPACLPLWEAGLWEYEDRGYGFRGVVTQTIAFTMDQLVIFRVESPFPPKKITDPMLSNILEAAFADLEAHPPRQLPLHLPHARPHDPHSPVIDFEDQPLAPH